MQESPVGPGRMEGGARCVSHTFSVQGVTLVGLTVSYVMNKSWSRTDAGAGEYEVEGGVKVAGTGRIG